MNKEIALNRIQNFLDKSSHHKWKDIQEAIDFLKESMDALENAVKGDYEIWLKGYQAGKK